MTTAVLWFRRDLRLTDNAALAHALQYATRIVPVYIQDPESDGAAAPGAASRWWLHHSLAALGESLAARGSRLILRRGPSALVLQQLIRETGAQQVCFNRLYEPERLAVDRTIELHLSAEGVQVFAGAGHLLSEPWAITNQSGAPYRVYTPYARTLRAQLSLARATPAPRSLPRDTKPLRSLALHELQLLPAIRWDHGLAQRWQPGEADAQQQLRQLARIVPDYAKRRDLPAVEGTTHLSPALHFGEVSPHQVWRALEDTQADNRAGTQHGAEALERELLWREFAHHVLHHFPQTINAPLDARFRDFPWCRSKKLLFAWHRGETGIPVVDAGMRELWATGFMHNRVRMITASFLTKHLRLDWRQGASWFWDTLVDADLANNTLNWQWVAGCGADAAPYFRIFNPVLQSRRFDTHGAYLLRWLPELERLPIRYRHAPWEAPAAILKAAGITLGRHYPPPLVDLAQMQAAALAAFRTLKSRHNATRTRRQEEHPYA